MTDLGTLGGGFSYAFGINSAGTIVGSSSTSSGANHASSYSDGVWTDLSPFLSSIGVTGYSYAMAINDNGDIVGYGYTAGGAPRAFLLAVPEPSTGALLALGAVTLFGGLRLRRRSS